MPSSSLVDVEVEVLRLRLGLRSRLRGPGWGWAYFFGQVGGWVEIWRVKLISTQVVVEVEV